jgi:hypothetical protein
MLHVQKLIHLEKLKNFIIIYSYLLYDTFNRSYYIASMISEWWIGKDVEGSDRGQI